MTARHPAAGLSLVETTVMLSVMLVLVSTLAPVASGMVADAQQLRASRDCGSIRDALLGLLLDSNRTWLSPDPAGRARVSMLVSSAATPAVTGQGDHRWMAGVSADGTVDLLDNYRLYNQPKGQAAAAWAVPAALGQPGWRGAYLSGPAGADPWGRRYAVNVEYLATRNEVIVISAGRNGLLETMFEGRALRAGGDDIAVLLH